MKNKICCSLMVIMLAQLPVFAGAILTRPVHSGYSAIQSTNSSIDPQSDENMEIYKSAIKEVQNEIKNNPNDYTLYASLTDLYMQSRQYDKAFDELIFLSNLEQKQALNPDVKAMLTEIYNRTRRTFRIGQINDRVLGNLAIMALILGDSQKARDYIIREADSRNTDINILKRAIEKVFEVTHNYDFITDACDKALQKNPSNTEIRKLKAYYLVQNKDNEAAINEYKQVLAYKSNDEEVKYSLYKLLYQSSNMSGQDIIKEIYGTLPDYEKAYAEIANILIKNNDIVNAKAFTDELIKKYPDTADSYLILSELYRKEGKLQDAYNALSTARDKADSPDEISKYNVLLAKLSDEPVREAHSLMANNLYKEALEVLNNAAPDNLYVILAQARANYFLNDKQKSFELLNKAMSLYPNNSDVFCAFGYIFLQEKDTESARKYTDDSLKINPDNKTAQQLLDLVNKADADKYKNSIVNAFESQNYTEAMRLTDEALSIDKKDAMLYYYKGLIFIAQNNYAESTAYLYKCLELDKNNAQAYFYLGIAFDNLSEPANAETYYRKFTELLPKDDYGESEKLKYAQKRLDKIKSQN